MEIDIITVTYNSEIWVELFVDSLVNCLYEKKKIHIYVVDNHSSDSTVKLMQETAKKCKDLFGSFSIIENNKNIGFGRASNLGSKYGKSEYVLFLNIDTELPRNSLINAINAIKQCDSKVGAWELRQFPFEHPKYYDPVTHITSWISGAAFIVKRNVFEEVKGFDDAIFLYAEDVDLSWRIRINGYNLQYLPDSVVYHYCYNEVNEIKPTQYINSIINNLNLRLRYGTMKDIMLGVLKYCFVILRKQPFKGAKFQLFLRGIANISKMPRFFLWRIFHKIPDDFSPKFYGWDYEVARSGAFYKNSFPLYSPLVSIMIRTHGRIDALKEALISIKNQTYKNIEVVVVEDGGNVSENLLKEEFSDLNIVYKSTGKRVGRSKAANIALDTASGEYLNFLDDDDLLFSDHVEILVNEALNSNKNVVYSVAFEVPTKIISTFSNKINTDYKIVYRQSFNRMKLFFQNYLPIQSVMFRKEVVQNKIYMDENLDALEDWDFWLKIALENEFHFVDKTTSIYRVPYDKNDFIKRQKALDKALEHVREKQKDYFCKISVYEVSQNVAELIYQNKTDKIKRKFKNIYKLYLLINKWFKIAS